MDNYEKVIDNIKIRLIEKGFSYTPGSIVRLFSEIIAESISEIHTHIDEMFLNCFISSANGNYIDLIGKLLNCKRLEKETDNNYKYRIVNKINTMATSNYLSIKMAALSVEGVDDINIKKYSMGSGSFTIVIIGNEVSENTIQKVYDEVEKVVACGIKFNVISVIPAYIKMSLTISFTKDIDYLKKRDIKTLVKQKIKNYINGLTLGEMFVCNKLAQIIMDCSEYILSFNVESFSIDDIECSYINKTVDWCYKFYTDKSADSIFIY